MMDSPRPFDADTLACVLVLTGTATPTRAALTAALPELYPAHGPDVNELLAAGWLVPTIDGRGLRVPPLSLAEQDAQLAAHEFKTAFAPGTVSAFNTTPPTPAPTTGIETEWPAAPLFNYYRGGILITVPYAVITPAQLYAVLISSRHRARTEALRAAPVGSPQRENLKKSLEYVTPAGTFTRRTNDALENSSGLLVLDFDHVPDLAAARAAALADAWLAPDLVLLFTSPSGDGLKMLVRTDPTASHLDNFNAWATYLGRTYAELGLVPDPAGKDVARACFVPYAPDAWLAPAYAA